MHNSCKPANILTHLRNITILWSDTHTHNFYNLSLLHLTQAGHAVSGGSQQLQVRRSRWSEGDRLYTLQTGKCCVHTRFPWHLASHGPSQHMLVRGILAYQIESGPAGQNGQSRKEKMMRSDTTTRARSVGQWFSALAAHWNNLGAFLKIWMPNSCPPPRDSVLIVMGCGLDSGIF